MRPLPLGILVGLLGFLAAPWSLNAQPPATPGLPLARHDLWVGQRVEVAIRGVQRVLIGNPSLLDVTLTAPNALTLIPKAPGRTFLLIWTPEGRLTRIVRIVPAYAPVTLYEPEERPAIDHAESLKVGYDVAYEFTRRGPTLPRTDQDTTTRAHHTVTHQLETPFGQTASLVEFTRVDALQDLTTWWARLTDGRLGPLDGLDVIVGDASIPFSRGLFAVPSTAYRGATVTYRGLAPWQVSSFWGRERSGVFGVPVGELQVERDSFLYGVHMGYGEPDDWWTLRGSALFGSGDERGLVQSDTTVDVANTFKLTEPWSLDSEVAVSEGEIGYTLGTSWTYPSYRLRLAFRDIDEAFHTIAGTSPDQGERGVLLTSQWEPTTKWLLRGQMDIFRNRLFPNPAEPDALNINTELSGSWQMYSQTTLSGFLNDRRDLGILSPNEDLRFGGFIDHMVSLKPLVPWLSLLRLNGRLEHQESRNVNNPSFDFNTEIFSLGVSLPLGGGLTAFATQQWNVVEETLTGARSLPRRLTTGLSYFSTLGRQWGVQGRFGYEDETRTESPRAFLAGQDRFVWEAGLRYQPVPSTRYFVDGRLERINFEGPQQSRFEVNLLAGVKTLFDTRMVHWDPVARIDGVVFHDLNGDGLRQLEEEGLPGVRITAGRREATTDLEGRFLFRRVAGKGIPVLLDVASLPKGFVASTPTTHVVHPLEGPRASVVFGALGRCEVRGRVFYDVDADGRYSAADRGLEGVQFKLDRHTATTDRTGWFFFRDLPGGQYTVTLVLESLPLRYLPLVPVRKALDLQEGQVATIDVPVTIRRSLQGRVYHDRNHNRQFDRGERVFRGMPVCLDERRATKTDGQGLFRFSDLSVGPHAVMLNCGMPLPELVPLSSLQPAVLIGPEDPEVVMVDFRLEELATVVNDVLRERAPFQLNEP